MGCAASVAAAASLPEPQQLSPAHAEPVKEAAAATATATSSTGAPAAEQREPESPAPSCRPTTIDRVNTFGAGARDELESPNIRVAAVKKKQETAVEDTIPTIITEEDGEDEDDLGPAPAQAQATAAAHAAPAPTAVETFKAEEDEGLPAPRPQQSESPTRRSSLQAQEPAQQQKQPRLPQPPKQADTWFGGGTSSVRTSDSQEFARLAPPSLSPETSRGFQGVAAQPARAAVSQVPTLPPLAAPKQSGPGRYDDITLSDDDDDDAQGFDLERWRRYYKWNRTKPADLLEFLWRRFDPRQFSIYVATYKPQDNLFAGFQGENVVHGLCCRLEKLRCDIFAILNTYYTSRADQYKVLGVFIFRGGDPPAELLALPDFEDYQLLKADTKDSAVRKFVGSLVTRMAPVPELSVVCSREVLGPT